MIKGLYIHIPFCNQICTYCDFCKLVGSDELQKEYIVCLIMELKHHKEKYMDLDTIYIGGGTPTSIDIKLLSHLLEAIGSCVDMNQIKEYTIEANPNDIDAELLEILKIHKISRISLGVQTTSNSLLRFLGRNHTREDISKAIELIKSNDFENFNLDFIYGIPNQKKEDVIDDLEFIKETNAPHVSYYSLILEDNTLLSHLIAKKEIKPLNEDLELEYGDIINNHLENVGYSRYEFSNHAKPSYESLHNLHYWNLDEYIGIGQGAASQFDDQRFVNPRRITDYIKSITNKEFKRETEEFDSQMEYLLMGLRKTKGIDMMEYENRYHMNPFDKYPGLIKHIEDGLLKIKDNHLSFTKKGIDLSNQVYLELFE